MTTAEKSIGHVCFVGQFEYFAAPSGDLMRAPITNPVMPDGYRGGRWECRAWAADACIARAKALVGDQKNMQI